MAKAAITKRTVDAATAGPRDLFIWDTDLSGFGLKVSPAGRKTYVYQYRLSRPGAAARTAPRRYSIGTHGQLTPDQARRRARELAALVATGTDPFDMEAADRDAKDRARQEVEDRARMERELAFAPYAQRWLEHYEHEKGRRPSSVQLARGIVENHLAPAFGDKPIPHIDRTDLQRVLDSIPIARKALRRMIFAYASVLFGWAVQRGDIPANPVTDMRKPEGPKARERVLTDDELAKVWKATACLTPQFGAFFRLLILTGQRRSEVAKIQWQELDRATATWVIPTDRAKNGVTNLVHLSDAALAELDAMAGSQAWPKAGYVLTTTGRTPISGISKAKIALDKAITMAAGDGEPLPHWRIHDLRRTMATGFQRLGVRFEVTEAVLNHVSGARGGVAGIYQRHDWKDEKRAALDAWAGHVSNVISPAATTNVVSFDAAKRSA